MAFSRISWSTLPNRYVLPDSVSFDGCCRIPSDRLILVQDTMVEYESENHLAFRKDVDFLGDSQGSWASLTRDPLAVFDSVWKSSQQSRQHVLQDDRGANLIIWAVIDHQLDQWSTQVTSGQDGHL